MITAENVIYRTYNSSDKQICCNLMCNTWMYERFFPNMKKPINLYAFMLASYLLESDYTEVAVRVDENNNEEVLGFLFGQTKPLGFFRKIRYFCFMLRVTVLWIFGAYGKRIAIYNLLKKMKYDEQILFADVTKKDAHLHLFFTAENARGLGIGKKLLARFENYCSEKNVEQIVLVTDTDCNYGFYEHANFYKVKEQKGCFGVPQTEEEKQSTATFVYGKKTLAKF